MFSPVSIAEYRALSELRYRIRCFLNFSEGAAREVGLEPQQHQLLLAIEGLPDGEEPTIGRIAERLQIAHNSAVDLVRRAVERGLVEKRPRPEDRRAILLAVTESGATLLESLSRAHRTELRAMAPALVETVQLLVVDGGAR